ncbi:MAG: serine hydrolase domain-containing protein [Bacteroidota bacterium]
MEKFISYLKPLGSGLVCFLLYQFSLGQEVAPALHTEIFAFIQKEKVPGMAMGFIQPQDSGLSVFGYREYEKRLKVEPTTYFGLGEVSQIFTHALMMKMELEGQIDLYRPLAEQVTPRVTVPLFSRMTYEFLQASEIRHPKEYPGVPIWGGFSCGKVIDTPLVPITYCRLATHFAGLCPQPGSKGRWLLSKKYRPDKRQFPLISSEEILTQFSSRELCAKPGESFQYSDWGIAVLGQLLTVNSTLSYGQMVKEEVFDPINMQHTHAKLEEDELYDLAQGYSLKGKKQAPIFWEGMVPSMGIYSTPQDMMHFLQYASRSHSSILHHAIRNTQAPEVKLSPAPKDWEGLEVGYGWWIQESIQGEYRKVWAEGRGSGYAAYIGYIEDQKRGVFLLANRSTSLRELGEKMLAILAKEGKGKLISKVIN